MAAAPPAVGLFEELAVGALASGVSPRTAHALRACCALLLLPQACMLAISLKTGVAVGHCCALLALSLLFLAAVSWLLSQLGTVSAAQQRAELGLDAPAAAAAQPGTEEKEKGA